MYCRIIMIQNHKIVIAERGSLLELRKYYIFRPIFGPQIV